MTYDWTFEAAGLMAAALPAAGWMAGRAYSRLRRGRPSQNAQISYDDGTLAHAEISSIIADTQSLVDEAIDRAANLPAATEAVQEEINSIIATVQEVSEMTSLLEAAIAAGGMGAMMGSNIQALVFLRMGETFNGSSSSFTVELMGNRGVQQFTFASGTTRSRITEAINMFAEETGVIAVEDDFDRDLVKLSSLDQDRSGFIRVQRLDGNALSRKIILDRHRENPFDQQKGHFRP